MSDRSTAVVADPTSRSKKILAFAGSNSRQSINKQLVGYAARLFEDGLVEGLDGAFDVEIIDLNDYEMPIYSVDRQIESGIPQEAHDFFAKVGAADAVVISFAEHNGFYAAAYKNIFDWASRIEMRVYQGKPAALFSTSIGRGGGANVLGVAVKSGQFFGYDVVASLAVPSFQDNFDPATGSLTDTELDARFRDALRALGSHPPSPLA